MPEKVIRTVVVAVKEIWLTKRELTISLLLVRLCNYWGLTHLVFEPQLPWWVLWELIKLNFDGSVQGHKVGEGFVVHNDIGVHIGASTLPVTHSLCVII